MPRQNPNANAQAHCPDCGPVTRRDFIRTTTGAIGALGVLGMTALPRRASGADAAVPVEAASRASVSAGPSSETLVAQLFGSLDEQQKKAICFPFEHEL